MSRDRFAELQAANRSAGFGQPSDLVELEMSRVSPSSANSMQGFLDEVQFIQNEIQGVRDTVDRIEQLHQRQLASVSDDAAAQRVTQELDNYVANASQRIRAIKGRLKAIEIANERVPSSSGDLQIRRSQAAALRKKFLDVAKQYQAVEQQHRQRVRERMERQYRIVKPDATPEEVEAAMAGQADVFAQNVLTTTRQGEARRALKEVQDRHEDVRKIEQTIMELAELFQEMALAVEQQGELIDSIEKSVGNAAVYTEEAVVQLDKAVEIRRSSRKKLWFLTCLIVVVLLIAALLVYLYVIRPALMFVPSSPSPAPASAPKSSTPPTAKAASFRGIPSTQDPQVMEDDDDDDDIGNDDEEEDNEDE